MQSSATSRTYGDPDTCLQVSRPAISEDIMREWKSSALMGSSFRICGLVMPS